MTEKPGVASHLKIPLENTCLPITDEMFWLAEAGFRPQIVWRKDSWAVLLCL